MLIASRPLSWINTAFPFAAAYLLGGGGIDLAFVLGTMFFLVPYNLAMYGINDVFDYESDLRNPRKGGVEGHLATPDQHSRILIAAVVACVPFLVYLFVIGSWLSNAVLVLSMFAVVAYSVKGLRFKEIPVLDSVTSSIHFSSPAWFGLALLGQPLDGDAWLILGAFFLWGVASQAFGAVQDVLPDREGGLKSVATAFGARATVRLATVVYLAAGVLLVLTFWPVQLAGLLALPYALNTGRFWSITDATSADAHRGWRVFLWLNYVVGFLVTMLMIWTALR
nr:prenyltransferase [Brevibacterium daeguense]